MDDFIATPLLVVYLEGGSLLASMCLVRALANNGQLMRQHVRFWLIASVLLAPVRFGSKAAITPRLLAATPSRAGLSLY
jgi:hypothetical protein